MSFTTNWQELGSPKMFAAHRKYLKDRGISDEVARINNLRSLTPAETAAVWPGRKCESLLVPYGKYYGSARAFGSDAKFLTTAGKGSRLYVPALPKAFKGLSEKAILSDPKNDECLIEGPFKTLAAVSHGILAIGISGCWNWQKNRQPLPDLLKYIWRARRSTPLFDADVTENNDVLLPYILLGDWLSSKGARVQFLRIPKVAGRKTGIDDYLAKHGKKEFDELRRENWEESEALEALRISALRTTEGGLASLFALQYSDDVRYDNTEECWYAWNDTMWTRQPKKAPDVQEFVKETVGLDHRQRQTRSKTEKRRQAMRKWGTSCDHKKRNTRRNGFGQFRSALRISIRQAGPRPHCC